MYLFSVFKQCFLNLNIGYKFMYCILISKQISALNVVDSLLTLTDCFMYLILDVSPRMFGIFLRLIWIESRLSSQESWPVPYQLDIVPMSWGCIYNCVLHLTCVFISHNLSRSRNGHSTLPKRNFTYTNFIIVEGALAYSTPYPGKIAVEQFNSWGREMKTTFLYCLRKCLILCKFDPR